MYCCKINIFKEDTYIKILMCVKERNVNDAALRKLYKTGDKLNKRFGRQVGDGNRHQLVNNVLRI